MLASAGIPALIVCCQVLWATRKHTTSSCACGAGGARFVLHPRPARGGEASAVGAQPAVGDGLDRAESRCNDCQLYCHVWATILRSQCYCVLFLDGVCAIWVLAGRSVAVLLRIRTRQLPLRLPGRVHHRHVRAPKPHIPLRGHLPPDHRLLVLVPTPKCQLAGVSLGLFGVFYSPGEGPVPFTYSTEAFPLYTRELGMSFATATTWFFNFVLSITFPSLLATFEPQGAFGFYAAWCCVLWVLILLFVRETKAARSRSWTRSCVRAAAGAVRGPEVPPPAGRPGGAAV
ncbi:hypothetical protein DFH07DRAFT_293456 [Mycena maculata]|uniref:Major facilitator superfamily (MFS) profile domain-containing protein n=1 Tax=Mycena maculata TaxID=230809 RepID=A0AAD7HKB9_9AGAR|nr:hypothetical protein DFH07DRAFT_293456 [Mycena maculata]